MPRFYVTTPIYYVNDVPHVGHAYTTVAADTIARWHRLRGHDVRFLTGTDEHGQKVMRAAEKLGRSPQAHADALHVRFKQLWERLDVACDDFIRTTEPRHREVVRAFLTQLWEKGEIYPADYSGWYSTSAERFWSDEEVAEAAGVPVADIKSGKVQGKCPDSGQPVEWITERNYFFRMSAYQARLVDHLTRNPGCIQPDSRRNEVLGYLRKPLGDLCISRPASRLPWGIPLPFDEQYVTYVWFDALTNYVSALGDARDRWWPADVHLVGKDILTFHTVYWFSMLFALGLEPPRQVYAHGWWTVEGQKMSKSIGNVVDPHLLVDAYGADAVRYFLLREIPFGSDGDFSHQAFLTRYNADLANDLGNLAHRALSMTEKWLGGKVPERGPETEADAAFRAVAERATATFATEIERLQFRQALEGLWELVRAGNKYVDTMEPWALNKRGDLARLGTVLHNALECTRVAASHLWCVFPTKSAALLAKLGVSAPFSPLVAGTPVVAGDPLFPRLQELPPAVVDSLRKMEKPPVSEPTPTAPPAPPAPIEYADFEKVALRVGKVLAAEKHPNADKLLVLTVDLGEEKPRTICAGIAAFYQPDALVGRSVVVVANLAPRKLRGVESNGMILATGPQAALLTPIADVPPGTVVK
ncbi:MAG: methionine--tRNA ligase [Myxococcota bacterium]